MDRRHCIYYTAEELSNMTIEELEKVHKEMEIPTQEQKQEAWKKMDIGIYDDKENLIGDKLNTLEDKGC